MDATESLKSLAELALSACRCLRRFDCVEAKAIAASTSAVARAVLSERAEPLLGIGSDQAVSLLRRKIVSIRAFLRRQGEPRDSPLALPLALVV